jgi:hypothetical protein
MNEENKETPLKDEPLEVQLKASIWHLVQAGNILDDAGFNDAAATIFNMAKVTLTAMEENSKLDASKLSADDYDDILGQIEKS